MKLRIIALCCAVFLYSEQGMAQSDLPLPRFVSTKSDEVNMRTGPGLRYPITWVFQRQYLPLEVIAEFEQWRKVRDIEGDEGWIHQSMLTGQRSVITLQEMRNMHREPDSQSATLAYIEPGAQAKLVQCQKLWCHVEVDDIRGWLPRAFLWGVYKEETVN